MPMAKLWNDNDYIYEEKFKGVSYVIEPHGYVEIDADEGLMLLGTYKPIKKTGQGTDDPRSFKKLRLEAPEVEANPLMCHANGRVAENEEELKSLLAAYAHMKASDKNAEDAARAKLAKENTDLRKDVEELKAMVASLVAVKEAEKPKKG
jgi:hypothetical protein